MENKTNWIAIIVTTVVSFALGMIWYGFLFSQSWASANNFTIEGEKMFKNGVEVPMSATPMILNLGAIFIYALLINWLIKRTGANTWLEGAKVGGAMGLIMAIGVYIGNSFAMNPTILTAIDGGYSFIMYTLMGAILGGWPAKK
jgi:hypothetical protein